MEMFIYTMPYMSGKLIRLYEKDRGRRTARDKRLEIYFPALIESLGPRSPNAPGVNTFIKIGRQQS